jgi:hypothetical protein
VWSSALSSSRCWVGQAGRQEEISVELREAFVKQLPLWFLLFSLLLPRISILVAYFLDELVSYDLSGWVPPTLAVLIPRALVLILIFQDRGMSPWLLVHAIAMALVYLMAARSN